VSADSAKELITSLVHRALGHLRGLLKNSGDDGDARPPASVAIGDVIAAQQDPIEDPYGAVPLALIVDGNAAVRRLIVASLSQHYRVRVAVDGLRGLELARQLRPDVVVSATILPELDGYEFCRRLRTEEQTKAIPLLMIVARTDEGARRALEAGASDYLTHPFQASELLARIGVHVRMRRMTERFVRQERLAALGAAAAAVAHNVRNPLSALLSGLPAVRKRLGASLDQSTAELMSVMQDCAERIERTTLDLLDLSRVDREQNGVFSPGAGLLACARILGSRLSVDIDLQLDVDDKASALGRAGDMNHVFMNVIDNALWAVGDKGSIAVCGAVDAESYLITVGDSGPGIAPDVIERIFEPFWTTRGAGEGTGLGLSIARQIIEEHGGSIGADASPLGGARFTIRLPLRATQRAVA
jgi:signal transduction histidine kinase